MKSVVFAIIGGAATLASATVHHYQGEHKPADTVTVTEQCGPAQTYTPGQYEPPKHNQGHEVTVTVTQTQTLTQTVGGAYTPPPPPPPPQQTGTATQGAPPAKTTYHVEVGTFNGTVKFVPNFVNAAIGDVIEYNFLAKAHSLTQSEFVTPCTFNGGFDSQLQPNPQNITGLHVVPLEVTTDKPQWFYCKQQGPPNHCGKGMVFGLNPKDKMEQFIANAIKQNGGATSAVASTTVSATSTGATSTATGAITTVTVGLDKGKTLKFDPPYIAKVDIGHTIHFDFRALNHTLTESSLYNPCKKLAGTDIDTNFQNVNKDDIPNFAPSELVVRSDKPRFFYCKQANGTPKGHCSKGMVFGLNIDEATFSQFEKNAEATLPLIKGRAPV